MSRENVETLRRGLRAFSEGDLGALRSILDEDSEWDWSRSIGPDKAVYRGPDEIIRFWREFASGFEEVRMDAEDAVTRGDELVAGIHSVMRGRGGIEVEARNAWWITLRDGKLRRLEMFQTRAEALEAAGISE